MYEKVNPAHPDKVADRIAGAIVDYAYGECPDPKIAVEVLIGHGECNIMVESSVTIPEIVAERIVNRIVCSEVVTRLLQVEQDEFLAGNQEGRIRCGDNGIFLGVPVKHEEVGLARIAKRLYDEYGSDGKYIVNNNRLTICQSCADTSKLKTEYPGSIVNPLGDWTGGIGVDCGATNRKLGSDMAGSVTGGGLHGKDLSKADVSVNIYAWLKAQETGIPVRLSCSIGDEYVDGVPYEYIVRVAEDYIKSVGGFEKFAEWGLIRGE